MSKLKTPVRYEPALDELNIGTRLNISDKVRPVLPIPILNLNPVSKNHSPVGKCLRCNKQGATLQSSPIEWKNYQRKPLDVIPPQPRAAISFSQRVKGVIMEPDSIIGSCTLIWTAPNYTTLFKVISKTEIMFLPFTGNTIYFNSNGTGDWEMDFYVWGFY